VLSANIRYSLATLGLMQRPQNLLLVPSEDHRKAVFSTCQWPTFRVLGHSRATTPTRGLKSGEHYTISFSLFPALHPFFDLFAIKPIVAADVEVWNFALLDHVVQR
jgi:hypothetical protein